MAPAAIIAMIEAAIEIIRSAPKAIEVLRQNHELTPEQERGLDDLIDRLPTRPEWQPDKP